MRHDARNVALDVLTEVESGGFLQPTLEARLRKGTVDDRERRLALELVMGVLRWRSRLDFELEAFLRNGLSGTEQVLLDLLRLALYQIRFLDRIPQHAAVHTAVEIARHRRGRGPSGFVNGVLRACLRSEALPLPSDKLSALSIEVSHPSWLMARWVSRYGFTEAKARANANNRTSPLTIRPQGFALDRVALSEKLTCDEGASVQSGRWSPDALNVLAHPRPFESQSFRDGVWTVQDEASQLVVRMLAPAPGDCIWDVCAAPGGKTRYIYDAVGGEAQILATDVNQNKVDEMARRFRGLNIEVRRVPSAYRSAARFDRVLVDAPCTALGLLHRHPEIRWRRSIDDVERCAEVQATLLQNAAVAVRPGGVLVYSVCSVTPEEGPGQLRQFLSLNPDFHLESPDDRAVQWESLLEDSTLQTTPYHHGIDGFFAARLRREQQL